MEYNQTVKPYAVKLTTESHNMTDLIHIQKRGELLHNFTVCVPCIRNYNNYHQLVDFIETNSLFGANHFVIYNYSHSKEVGKYLSHYIRHNVVSIVPWHMPKTVLRHVHQFGQLALVADCLYRNMFVSKYIVFIDVDETIVPSRYTTWKEMLEAAEKSTSEKFHTGGYSFRCKFFQCCKRVSNATLKVSSQQLQIQAKKYNIKTVTVRTAVKKAFKHGIRSKVIVKPQAIDYMNIHQVGKFISNFSNILVNQSIGLLNHYRVYLQHSYVKDIEDNTVMDKFAPDIVARVKTIHKLVEQQSHWLKWFRVVTVTANNLGFTEPDIFQ